MEKRIYNFSAGPAILPEEVLLEAQKELFALPGVGMSILEISHRSKTFDAILADAKAGIKNLLSPSPSSVVAAILTVPTRFASLIAFLDQLPVEI